MIMFVMALLVLVPLYAAIEAIWLSRGQPVARAVLAGLAAGGLIWNGPKYADAFPGFGVGLGVLGVAAFAWAAFRLAKPLPALISAAVTATALSLFWDVALLSAVNRVAPMSLERNAMTGPRVLIVYHPGGSAFQRGLVMAMVEEFGRQGLAADIATAGPETPVPQGYALMVLSTPTYNWGEAARPVQDYAARIGPLEGLPVAGLTTGAGWAPNREVEALLTQAGGRLIAGTAIFTTAPNFLDGTEVTAEEAARHFARQVATGLAG